MKPFDCFNSKRKRKTADECLFTWEDVDEFNAEKDEKRGLSKIKIDGERFVDYIKDLSKKPKNSPANSTSREGKRYT